MPDFENRAWAYSEGEHKKRKKSLEEGTSREETEQFFEVQKLRVSKNVARHNLLSLKEKIRTGVSLTDLKNTINDARKSGEISDADFREVQKLIDTIDRSPDDIFLSPSVAQPYPITLPFQDSPFVKRLEASRLGDDLITDIVGIAFGFFIQGGYILGYIVLRLLFDALLLPRDLYRKLTD